MTTAHTPRKVEPVDKSAWSDAEVSFALRIKDLEDENRRLKAKIADGIHAFDMMEMRAENEALREGLSAALEKLGQPDCDECGGVGSFTDRQGHRECPECSGLKRSWV